MSISADVQFALQISSVAAFAIPGPAGVLVSAGLTGISDMLSPSPQSDPPVTPQEVQSIVTGTLNANELDITNANVQTAVQEFMSYMGPNLQFNVDVPKNLSYAITHEPNDPGVIFYQLLTSWLTGENTGSSILLQEINQLEPSSQGSSAGAPTPTYSSPQVVNFNGFLRAVSFYLVVYKVWAIFNQEGGSPFNSNQCSFVQTQLRGWMSFAQTLSSSIESQITNRLGQITPITPYTYYVPFQYDSLVYFADNGAPVPGFTPPPPLPGDGSISHAPTSNNNVIASMYGDNNAPSLQAFYSQYVANMTTALDQAFGDFDQSGTQGILGNWQAVAQELTYMLAHKGLPAQS